MACWTTWRKPCLALAIGAVAAALSGCGDGDDRITASPATEAPRVAAMAPAPGNDYVAADQEFVVEFTQPMDRAAVEGEYAVTMGGRAVAGRFAWSDDHRAMAFALDASLTPGAQVQVRRGAGMRGANGRRLVGQDGESVGPLEFACTAYAAPTEFSSAGEQIYFTATSPSGEAITFAMGDDFDGLGMPGYGAMGTAGMGMMGGGMMGRTRVGMGGAAAVVRHYGMACASCHGPQGEGGRYLAMGGVRTPSLRYAVLTGEEGYGDDDIARAIAEGVEPDGEGLSGFMPRWAMSPADMQALVEYLKTL